MEQRSIVSFIIHICVVGDQQCWSGQQDGGVVQPPVDLHMKPDGPHEGPWNQQHGGWCSARRNLKQKLRDGSWWLEQLYSNKQANIMLPFIKKEENTISDIAAMVANLPPQIFCGPIL
jgi:hypothetical protein